MTLIHSTGFVLAVLGTSGLQQQLASLRQSLGLQTLHEHSGSRRSHTVNIPLRDGPSSRKRTSPAGQLFRAKPNSERRAHVCYDNITNITSVVTFPNQTWYRCHADEQTGRDGKEHRVPLDPHAQLSERRRRRANARTPPLGSHTHIRIQKVGVNTHVFTQRGAPAPTANPFSGANKASCGSKFLKSHLPQQTKARNTLLPSRRHLHSLLLI